MLVILAQLENAPEQTEYLAAYALIVMMVLLGLLVVCIPRPRAKHFVEPEGEEEDSKKKRKKFKRKKP